MENLVKLRKGLKKLQERGRIMPEAQTSSKQQKITDFLRTLQLTMAIAGLPQAAPGSHFTEGQLEARATTLKHAYKAAQQLLTEISES